MKIYAIAVVKNEVDIIGYSLKNAAEWADKVIVFDNGSDDGTWEKVKSLKNRRIIAYKQDDRPYSDGIRAEIFNAFKAELTLGDWWVIQDSDEIYEENPREFIARQKGYFHHINGKKVDFSFDLNNIDSINFTGDFEIDVQNFNHYTPEAWSEPRAIKHRHGLVWEEKKIWPSHMGLVCKNAIRIRHYPLRSLEQIKQRWQTRRDVKEKGGQVFNHWQKDDWREYYENKARKLIQISSGEDVFEHVPFANDYRQSLPKRIVKTVLHRTGILP